MVLKRLAIGIFAALISSASLADQYVGPGPRADTRPAIQTINSATLNATASTTLNNGQGVSGIEVTGITAAAATLTIEYQGAGSSAWYTKTCGLTLFSTITADGTYVCSTPGDTALRVRVSATGSGNVSVYFNATATGPKTVDSRMAGTLPTEPSAQIDTGGVDMAGAFGTLISRSTSMLAVLGTNGDGCASYTILGELHCSNNTAASAVPDDRTHTFGNITVADSGVSSTTGYQSALQYTGAATSGSYYEIGATTGYKSVFFQITGTWSATLQFEKSYDWGNCPGNGAAAIWNVMKVKVAGATSANSGETTVGTSNGNFVAGIDAGVACIRVRASALASGTAVIQGSLSDAAGGTEIFGPLPPGSNAIGTVAASNFPTTVDTGAGNSSASTPRVVIATNQPSVPVAVAAGTNLIGKVGIDQTTPGTTNAVSATNFPSTVSTGTGAQGASSPRVTVATDSATVAGSASIPAGSNLIGKTGIDQTTPGTTNAVSATNLPSTVSVGTGATGSSSPRTTTAIDNATVSGQAPCTGIINITQTTTTDVHTFTNTGWICSIVLVSAAAQSIGVDEGTGTTCETSGTALIGVSSTSSATPTMALAANGGFAVASGVPQIKMQASADHICVLQSSSGNVSGYITYADHT